MWSPRRRSRSMAVAPLAPRGLAAIRARAVVGRALGPLRRPLAVVLSAVLGRVPVGLRAPGAVETVGARRRRRRAERRTRALGVLALGTTGAVLGTELTRVWRRGSAPLPTQTENVLEAAEEAARQTVEVAVAGYRQASSTETALLNMLGSFAIAFGMVRASTHLIRRRGTFGPFRNVRLGEDHIHHFIPGISLAFAAGGTAVLVRDDRLDPWLAIPFGVGVALTLDESALLLKLDDVYWTEEGIVSVQITLAVLATLSAAMLALRVLRQGEERVLEAPPVPPPRAPRQDALF
jgi:hypothetical protein